MLLLSMLGLLILFKSFPKVRTIECGTGTYHDTHEGCVACGVYPIGCNAFNNISRANCLRECKSKF